MRPYKGIDLLLEAWRGDRGRRAVDRRHAAHGHLRRCARAPRASVRFVAALRRPTTSSPRYFRRADLVVLPYREIDQSGVLFTALAFGKPLLLSDVGGFPEVAATGAARGFPARATRRRCTTALRELLARPERARGDGRARRARPPRARTPGRRSRAHAGALRDAARERSRRAMTDRARDRLLGLARADRVDAGRLRAALAAIAALLLRPPRAGRPPRPPRRRAARRCR